mmetsp:Transcript_43434/g.72230  ORF Transcript_43434/g.72230 Transcript_43434/m.72230 type:complete len:94 (+) Transcript_43434:270-551(+)
MLTRKICIITSAGMMCRRIGWAAWLHTLQADPSQSGMAETFGVGQGHNAILQFSLSVAVAFGERPAQSPLRVRQYEYRVAITTRHGYGLLLSR